MSCEFPRWQSETGPTKEAYDLHNLTRELTKAFPQIEGLYLFGSRRYRTGSLRSDVDILVEPRSESHIRLLDLRAFSAEQCPALDLFVAEEGKAVSWANESHVRAGSCGELVIRLEAICGNGCDQRPRRHSLEAAGKKFTILSDPNAAVIKKRFTPPRRTWRS
jgi:hypothetical protein